RALLDKSDPYEAGLESLMGHRDQMYMPSVMAAYLHWPDYPTSRDTFNNLYYHPDTDIPLDIPELLVLLGALKRAGYTPIPTEIYSAVLMKRIYAMDAVLVPDPSWEEPVGVDYNALLTDAYEALGEGTKGDLRKILDSVFGSNPRAFRTTNPSWGVRLVTGEEGLMKIDPKEMFHRAAMTAVMLDHRRVKPAFDAVADDKRAVNEYRFSAAAASLLLAQDPRKVDQFRKRIFGNPLMSRYLAWPAYRLLAQHKDPVTYEAIKEALDKLPAPQHVDYGEFLALYGNPADLAAVQALVDDPLTPVDLKLTEVRSPALLNPETKDLTVATQNPDATADRLGKDELLKETGEDDQREILPGRLPLDVSGERAQQDRDTAKELNVPAEMLHDKRYTEGQLRARRLWWLRSFPMADIEPFLQEKLRRGTEEEQVVALRILGQYGDLSQLGTIGVGLGSKHQRVRLEAAVWYLALKYRVEGYPPELQAGSTSA
ncbi:MAG TPA: hypothetical protein VEI97_12645, partial [bacterium]|nr:hypothetical protein [bacterium]